MRIIHVEGLSSPNAVDGINNVIWSVAAQQASLGHDVGIVVTEPLNRHSYEAAQARNIELMSVPASRWSYDGRIDDFLAGSQQADIVHFHSVYIPRHATLARKLRRWMIPYIVTPHGGLMPQVLARGRIKKAVYNSLVERRRISQAAGIAYVTPSGEDDIRAFMPDFTGPVRWTPNPVDVEQYGRIARQPDFANPKLTFLGRYDVFHKGLDRLAEIARRLPEVEVDLYGVDDPKTSRYLDIIRRHAPPNLRINEPVFGDQKLEILATSTMYIQVSRWEALSISILEALAMGLPTVISESMSMAEMFSHNDLGLVVSQESARAAEQIRQALAEPVRLHGWSQRSREYARNHFSPSAVANRVMDVYEEALSFHTEADRDSGGTVESHHHSRCSPSYLAQQDDQEERNAGDLQHLLDGGQRRKSEAVVAPGLRGDS